MYRHCLSLVVAAMMLGCGTVPQGLPATAIQRDAAVVDAAEAHFGVSGQFRLSRRPLSILRPTYDVAEGERKVGVIQRKFFAATSTWRLMDGDEQEIGSLEQASFAFGFKALVRALRGTVVGEVKQDVLRSLVRPGVVLQVFDEDRSLVLRSSPAWFTWQGRVDLLDGQGQKIGSMLPVWFARGEARLVDLQRPIDRRLLLAFLAAQLDLSERQKRPSNPPSTSPTAPPSTGPAPAPTQAPSTPPPAPPVPSAPPVLP
ncbi:MAG: hypothetical protein VKP62_15220 [Candidatus Sericytochromatia bacterium]|nr:hypothetical protein [Candidatus Sericytochromatia bacterium]